MGIIDQLYYNNKGVQITVRELTIDEAVCPLPRVETALVRVENPERLKPILCIVSGILLAPLIVGLVLIWVGWSWWRRQEPVYWFVVKTKEGKTLEKRSRSREAIEAMVAALEAALHQQGVLAALAQVVREQRGTVTLNDVCTGTGLSVNQAKDLLDQMVEEGRASAYADPRVPSLRLYEFKPDRG